jgi:CDP-glycerol glycerophosphotransferase (TagB/SpsB family)
MKKGEQGENRTTSDPVTITAKPAWRPDETSETHDSHHAVSGDSEVDVAARVSREEDH